MPDPISSQELSFYLNSGGQLGRSVWYLGSVLTPGMTKARGYSKFCICLFIHLPMYRSICSLTRMTSCTFPIGAVKDFQLFLGSRFSSKWMTQARQAMSSKRHQSDKKDKIWKGLTFHITLLIRTYNYYKAKIQTELDLSLSRVSPGECYQEPYGDLRSRGKSLWEDNPLP